ncbi:unnamed protein product [Miscanthus lutarioriparius]|uniref:F-box domain-containing protein n=1 Tax=Miscanthus lutarioriparius TaxID=422564 RepID=A0A811NM74_9POAL|nr:unnamed protein product [Miscanthus lutarioriparius]
MASRVRLTLPNPEAAEPERPPPDLTNDLLEEIFLRVASPADLARASTACVSFRRLIADHSFLRRYRSIHPPLLLGFVSSSGFHPVKAPHPSAAVARAADFSFDHLTRPTTEWLRWRPCDVRNGRVLVGCRSIKGAAYWDLAVCDLLSRRYLLLPPITDDLLASVELQNHSQCAYDCFYWKLYNMSTSIKFDMNTMQFCTVDLPPGHDEREIVMVESGESKVAMFSLSYKSTSVDYYTFSQNGSEKSQEWHMMSTIPLPAHYTSKCYIGGPAEGYIFIECIRDGESSTYSTVLSLEIKSFNIERVSRTSFPGRAYPYFGFPPSMSPRRI